METLDGCQPSSYSHIGFRHVFCRGSFDLDVAVERALALLIRLSDDLESRPDADGVGESMSIRLFESVWAESIKSM